MLLYKYRGGNDKTFERDLKALKHNYFYAPSYDKLNDPCETTVLSDKFHIQAKIINKLFSRTTEKGFEIVKKSHQELINRKNEVGIYAMSKTFNDELMWAYYADSHRGFCIEYDSHELIDNDIYEKKYLLDVVYSKHPPQLGMEFIDKRPKDLIKIIGRLAGTKSKRWKHEKEIRIITDKSGIHSYNYKAVKTIYFGLKMPEENKQKIMDVLQDRGVCFLEMLQKKNLYAFEERLTLNCYINRNAATYMEDVPINLNNGKKCKIKIAEIKYYSSYKKGTIDIEIERPLMKKALKWLANTIKNELFYTSEKVFIGYRLKGVNTGAYWASTHFTPKLDIKVMGIYEDDWDKMKANKVSGKIIRSWKDNETYTESILYLVEENDKLFIKIVDKSSTIRKEEITTQETNTGTKYIYPNKHGEYYMIENNGCLGFYSPDGKWKEAEKFS